MTLRHLSIKQTSQIRVVLKPPYPRNGKCITPLTGTLDEAASETQTFLRKYIDCNSVRRRDGGFFSFDVKYSFLGVSISQPLEKKMCSCSCHLAQTAESKVVFIHSFLNFKADSHHCNLRAACQDRTA